MIEAAPERPDLKRELFAALSDVCGPETVLATNTSSIPVTSLAGAAARPDRVVGMHFFNPPPLMRLLEVIPAEQTGTRTVALARATGEAMGKRVIVAADGPGFLVNRCGRPFGAEALRLVQERVATPEQVDRICRLGGGFRMGPFELMDLVGIDVGFEVAQSFTELSFGEPRWKPSPLQARMVAAGRLGRKSGRGWYEYGDGPHRPDDPPPLRGRCRRSSTSRAAERRARAAVPSAASRPTGDPAARGLSTCCPGRRPGRAHARALGAEDGVEAAERVAAAAGLHHEWVGDAPGLVLGRIVCLPGQRGRVRHRRGRGDGRRRGRRA